LDVAVYSLYQTQDEETPSTQTRDEDDAQFTVTQLPHKAMDGLWESLVYAEPIPETILRIITRMMKISKEPHLNPAVIHWHNLILLYGPPGSGKTTLAHALAQKLSIRLAHDFSTTKLVEVNSHTLLSKWFGESSKLVGKLFETISSISSDESLLTVVIIDEVETLAGSREKASQANECGDAIRATNELLQGLDKLRKRTHVIFICTSNLEENMDEAFMDRCGIKRYIEAPNVECTYEIFRSVINELIKSELVCFNLTGKVSNTNIEGSYITSPSSSKGEDHHTTLSQLVYIPDLEWINLHPFHRSKSAARELLRIARGAQGLSGRTLRRLPMLAMAEFTTEEPCELAELLVGLARAVKEEHKTKFGDNSDAVMAEGERDVGLSEDDLGDIDHLTDFSMDGDLVRELFGELSGAQNGHRSSSSHHG
ncbi:AAA-domain-containing protein, partial [Lindgomyces ingoldianus]